MFIYKSNPYNEEELQTFLEETEKNYRFLGEDLAPQTVVKQENGLFVVEIAEENDEVLDLLSTCEKAMKSVKMDQEIWASQA